MNWSETIIGVGSRRRSMSCRRVWIVVICLAMTSARAAQLDALRSTLKPVC